MVVGILGIGLDMVELARIESIYERHGDAFVRRFSLPGEVKKRQGGALIEHLGGLFAAKEAAFKALGTGWAGGVGFKQVEVVRRPSGAPTLRLHGRAAERAAEMGVQNIHLTITHERAYAAAVAIFEGAEPG